MLHVGPGLAQCNDSSTPTMLHVGPALGAVEREQYANDAAMTTAERQRCCYDDSRTPTMLHVGPALAQWNDSRTPTMLPWGAGRGRIVAEEGRSPAARTYGDIRSGGSGE